MSQRVETARRLRRGQTDAERVLWLRLRDRRLNGWKFKRQVPIDRYVADFCCEQARLIIELDGGQHTVQTEADAKRTEILEAMGYLVLRFWNNDVLKNTSAVLEAILETIEQLTPSAPHPDPLPSGERERRH
jgi:very-short-patch-repair endonuclease